MVAVRGKVRLGEGLQQIRPPDTFTSVNIYRARNGEEMGGPRGYVGKRQPGPEVPREGQRERTERQRH